MEAQDPRGTFGNIVHALTFGIFGNQKERINRHVETEYRVKSNDEDQKYGTVDNHPFEEYNDESIAQSSNSTENIYQTNINGSNKRLVKFKKTKTQKDQEAETLQKEEQTKKLSKKERQQKIKEAKEGKDKDGKEKEEHKEEKNATKSAHIQVVQKHRHPTSVSALH